MESHPLRGFRDLLPPESELAAAFEAAARQTLSLYGFREIRIPTLELRELFVKATGETTDIVEKEMFQLEDAGGRNLALRPEGTPGVVRAFIDQNLSQQGPLAKLFYIGGMFRAERPQAGRYREFSQLGVETLGNPHPAADVESILALSAVLEKVGLEGKTQLRLANLGCEEDAACRPLYRERLRAHLTERRDSLCDNCKRRIERNPLRVMDCKGDGPKLAAEAPRLEPCAACRAHVDAVALNLDANGLEPVYPDFSLVRGLDYYNRTVFEFRSDLIGAQDALAGGGRYDGLTRAMGGPAAPAVGWALGVERVLLAARAGDPETAELGKFLPPLETEVFVATTSADPAIAGVGIRILESLRRFGIRAAGGLFDSSLKAQMREADRRKARFSIILGVAELKRMTPECVVKDMAQGKQSTVELASLLETVGDMLLCREPRLLV